MWLFSYNFALFSLLFNGYSDNQHCFDKIGKKFLFVCLFFQSREHAISNAISELFSGHCCALPAAQF
jgi:hypothetical protein